MTSKSEKIKAELVYVIGKMIQVHNNQNYKAEDLDYDTKTIDIFPCKPIEVDGILYYVDEQANRMGIMMLETLDFLKKKYDFKMDRVGYLPRQEFQLFPTLDNVYNHFFNVLMEKRPDLFK